jgi:hypothetical protein
MSSACYSDEIPLLLLGILDAKENLLGFSADTNRIVKV